MDWKLLGIFAALTIVNVVLSTIRSLCTINCGKTLAALANAICYGFYVFVIVWTVSDLPIWWKAGITAVCNFVGVYAVKLIEEKARKDKLWKVEATVPSRWQEAVHFDLRTVPHSYIEAGPHTIFNFYCATQADSKKVKDIINQYGAKYFVSESKTL